MRAFAVCMALVLLCLTAGAQTNVDKLVRKLDTLTTFNYNDWKASPDLRTYKPAGDPTMPGFDDSKWDNLRIHARIYPDSCWLRKEITLPENVLGQKVTGAVKLLVTVDDAGYLWVDGRPMGYFPWDGEFELTKDAHPGQKILLAIKAINTGGPMRLLRAEVQLGATTALKQKVEDFALSLRTGEKLLSFDTYQTNANRRVDPKTDKSAMDRAEKTRLYGLLQDIAAQVDLSPLAAGALDKFTAILDDARAKLKPIGAFAKRFTLYFDANAHIDAAWLWRDKETILVCRNTFASVDNMMNARPDFTYTQSSAAYYDWMERYYPDVFRTMQERVKQGRWEIVGGMWIEPDCNLPSGESWSHQLLYAQKYFQKKFGVKALIGWNPDSFGYDWNMPEFYQNAGMDAFITQKIGWNETNVFPYRVFWWEGPDGSKILTYFPFDYVNTIDNPYRLVDWSRQFEANTGFTKMLILFGVATTAAGRRSR
jgi:alpha-mannosidase